mmetsp:Transcript_183279/g.581184  ORF Transcript_183279/g.581184 Transcript_183279/m.581184 type:complete len:224 (+) Transcript_183279:836-1507(+)
MAVTPATGASAVGHAHVDGPAHARAEALLANIECAADTRAAQDAKAHHTNDYGAADARSSYDADLHSASDAHCAGRHALAQCVALAIEVGDADLHSASRALGVGLSGCAAAARACRDPLHDRAVHVRVGATWRLVVGGFNVFWRRSGCARNSGMVGSHASWQTVACRTVCREFAARFQAAVVLPNVAAKPFSCLASTTSWRCSFIRLSTRIKLIIALYSSPVL